MEIRKKQQVSVKPNTVSVFIVKCVYREEFIVKMLRTSKKLRAEVMTICPVSISSL